MPPGLLCPTLPLGLFALSVVRGAGPKTAGSTPPETQGGSDNSSRPRAGEAGQEQIYKTLDRRATGGPGDMSSLLCPGSSSEGSRTGTLGTSGRDSGPTEAPVNSCAGSK